MSKLRNGTCYRHLKIPYTRTSKRKSKAFIVGIPGSKIVRFVLGEKSKKFDSQVVLISEKDINLRHNCLESARIASVRFIELKAGKNNFRLVIHPFPHHIMRENPIAAGAGADRFQKGMTHAFGKPYGRAARVKTGTKVISIYCDKSNIPFAKTAMKRATGKLPITGHIKVINNPKQ